MGVEYSSDELGPGDRVRFFAVPRLDGLECLSASFRTHAYVPHAHDSYAVGVIVAGCETWMQGGRRHYAVAGDFGFVNPDEVHDGAPTEDGYAYRMTYPSEALLADLAEDLSGSRAGRPAFSDSVIPDPDLAPEFVRAHRALEREPGSPAAAAAMLDVLARGLVRHAGARAAPVGDERGSVGRALALIEEGYAGPLSLEALAEAAGLPRHRLIRAFRKTVGLTPHAAVLDRRVRAARLRLRRGETPGEAALAAGFADQSHLTRAFKARLGVTPAAYRAAVAG